MEFTPCIDFIVTSTTHFDRAFTEVLLKVPGSNCTIYFDEDGLMYKRLLDESNHNEALRMWINIIDKYKNVNFATIRADVEHTQNNVELVASVADATSYKNILCYSNLYSAINPNLNILTIAGMLTHCNGHVTHNHIEGSTVINGSHNQIT